MAWLAGQQFDSPLTVLTDNVVGSIDKDTDMSIVKNNVNRQIISADDVVQQNNIKMTIDIVSRQHQPSMTS